MKIHSDKTILTLAIALTMAMLFIVTENMGFCTASLPSQHATAEPQEKLSSASVDSTLPKSFENYVLVNYLGMTDKGDFIAAIDNDMSSGSGLFERINAATGKVIKKSPVGSINAEGAILSADGKTIFAFGNYALLLIKPKAHYYVNNIDIYPSASIAAPRVLDTGAPHNVHGLDQMQNHPQYLAVRTTVLLPYQNSEALLDDHVEIWNWKKHHLVRRFKYAGARGISKIVSGPDENIMAFFFTAEDINRGLVDIVNDRTGASIFHIAGTDNRPVRAPVFFLPDGRFVSGNIIYDVKKHTTSSVLPGHPSLRCISATADISREAFFQSDNGLELWDIIDSKLIKIWPQIKKPVRVFLSPNRKVLAALCSPDVGNNTDVRFLHNTTIEFWKFSPHL